MIRRYNNRSVLCGVPGIFAQLAGQWMLFTHAHSARLYQMQGISPPPDYLGQLLLFLGTIGLPVAGATIHRRWSTGQIDQLPPTPCKMTDCNQLAVSLAFW